MSQQTPGSFRSPVGQIRVPSLTAAGIGGVLVALFTLPCAPLLSTAQLVTDDVIFCGSPLARQLMSGATNTFRTSLLPGTVLSTDIIATENIGVLKMQAVNFSDPSAATCSGDLALTAATPAEVPGAPAINVTDCFSLPAARDYTLTLSVVSEGPDNCGVPLSCGTPVNGSFQIRGEVDSYTFRGVEGDEVSLEVAKLIPADTGVRLRLFDPDGVKIYDDNVPGTCSGLPGSNPLQKLLPKTGAYTLLVSRCMGSFETGQYTVTWRPPPPGCGSAQPSGQFAYVANSDSGTLTVIDLSTNTARLSAPITPLGRAELVSPTFVTITPNGGFAWATYGTSSTTSVINTSTNLLKASPPTGLDAGGVAISPDGTLAYVLSNSLEGIAVVDTKTNKVTRVAALDPGFYQGLATGSTSDGTFLYAISEDIPGLVKVCTADVTDVTLCPEPYVTVAITPLDVGLYDAFAVSPNGSFIYAGILDGIAVVDTTTMLPTHQIAVGEPFAIAFTPDGRTAYATIADGGAVAVIDTATQQVIDSILVGDRSPGGIAISPDTLLAYVTDFSAAANETGVLVIDTRTNKVIATTPSLGDAPTSIALTTAPTGLCVGDAQGKTEVTVDKIVLSVNYLLNGCPGRFPSVPFP